MSDPEMLIVEGSSVPIDRPECRECRAVRFADDCWHALLTEKRAHMLTREQLRAAEARIAALEGAQACP